MNLDVGSAASLSAIDSERSAHLARPDGIVRLDLRQGTATPLTAADGLTLENFERIVDENGPGSDTTTSDVLVRRVRLT